jgi:hypothetical protein
MSSAWAGGTDAIIERMEQMTTLFIEVKLVRHGICSGVVRANKNQDLRPSIRLNQV